MAFNDIYRFRLYQTLHGAQVVNVIHFVQDDPLPTRGGLELANDFLANMATTLKARATNALTFNYIEVQKLVPFEGGPVIVAWTGGSVGTGAGTTVSATLAEVVTIYSQRAGRRGRGRIYLTGQDQSSSSITAGTWQSLQSTKTLAFANALYARYIDANKPIGWALGVWSRAAGPAAPPWTTSQFARATGLSVRTIVRTQRRRQVGVGR
jgi:hypothetical protein